MKPCAVRKSSSAAFAVANSKSPGKDVQDLVVGSVHSHPAFTACPGEVIPGHGVLFFIHAHQLSAVKRAFRHLVVVRQLSAKHITTEVYKTDYCLGVLDPANQDNKHRRRGPRGHHRLGRHPVDVAAQGLGHCLRRRVRKSEPTGSRRPRRCRHCGGGGRHDPDTPSYSRRWRRRRPLHLARPSRRRCSQVATSRSNRQRCRRSCHSPAAAALAGKRRFMCAASSLRKASSKGHAS